MRRTGEDRRPVAGHPIASAAPESPWPPHPAATAGDWERPAAQSPAATQTAASVRPGCDAALLAGYRSPFTGASGADNPVVFAGFVITNGETECGAFSPTPQLVVQVCRNGMTITRVIRGSLETVWCGG